MTTKDGVACRLCGGETLMLATKLCDPCWELERRVTARPELAAAVLRECLVPVGLSWVAQSPDLADVDAFHRKYKLPRSETPALMSQEVFGFRHRFLQEEAAEFSTAVSGGDLVGAADALIDLSYVAYGTALFVGGVRRYRGWSEFSREGRHAAKAFGMIGDPGAPRLPTTAQANMVSIRLDAELYHLAVLQSLMSIGGADYRALHRTLHRVVTVAYGAAYLMGVPWEHCWRHVHRKNMEKVRARRDGGDSKRGTGWDVVKPAGWTPPDPYIREELEAAGWRP